jgi:hypothetical protein
VHARHADAARHAAGAPPGGAFPSTAAVFGAGAKRTPFGAPAAAAASDDEDAGAAGDEPQPDTYKPICTLPEAPRVRASAS